MPTELPTWVGDISIFAVAMASAIAAVYKYFKTDGAKAEGKPAEPPAAASTAQVVAASFVDSRLLKELIDTLREHAEENERVAHRVTRALGELREAVIESNEALKLQTDATLNMLRFINRQNTLK